MYEPREDSEMLMEVVSHKVKKGMRVLDMGAGSGVQAMVAASRGAEVTAADLDQEAVDYVRKLGIKAIRSDLFENIKGKFDMIIFNPPYLPNDEKYKDLALDGGPKGNELIIRFLNDAGDYLSKNGFILLLFSSLSHPSEILIKAVNKGFSFQLLRKKRIFFEELYVYELRRRDSKNQRVEKRRRNNPEKQPNNKANNGSARDNKGHEEDVYDDERFLAKGKRGEVFLRKKNGRLLIIKRRNPEAAVDTVAYEAKILSLINKIGLGPKLYDYDKRRNELIREYVKGTEIKDYLPLVNKKEAVRVLLEVFRQCRKLDLMGINKLELVRPLKHIIITPKGRVVQIDFERCKESRKPKNVTQFAEFCRRSFVREKIDPEKKLSDERIISLMKAYKRHMSVETLDNLTRYLLGSAISRERSDEIYELCMGVPPGRVTSYSIIAKIAGTSPRAVGSILRRNPYKLVPCHRVIMNNGELGSYFGLSSGKKEILELEGVPLINGRFKGVFYEF